MSFSHQLINDLLCPEYGSSKQLGYNTRVQRGQDRRVRRVTRSENALRAWDVSADVKTVDEARDVLRFHMAMQGTVTGFLYRDERDKSTAADDMGAPDAGDVEIGVGDGLTTEFQLVKRYVNAHRTETYRVEKPVASSVVVALDGVVLDASLYSVNETTGIITFTTAPSSGVVITVGFYFNFPVRFATELGGDLTITNAAPTIDALGSIILEELPNEGIVVDWVNRGGASNLGSTSTDVTISPTMGQVIRFQATAVHGLRLPAVTGLPRGEYWTFINQGVADAQVYDAGQNLIRIIPASTFARTFLIDDGAGNSVWSILAC